MNMNRIFKIIGIIIIITVCVLESCLYNFLVKKENTLYKKTGFIVSTYSNNFFIPYNLKEAYFEEVVIISKGSKEVEPNRKGKQVIKELEKNQ